jgi:hypothetical protein
MLPTMPRQRTVGSHAGELRRLGYKADWTFGIDPRHDRGGGSNGEVIDVPESGGEEEAKEDEAITSEDEESVAETVVPKAKPTHLRVILEVSQLQQVFAQYPCPKCKEVLELKICALCITSSLELVCNNNDCS